MQYIVQPEIVVIVFALKGHAIIVCTSKIIVNADDLWHKQFIRSAFYSQH